MLINNFRIAIRYLVKNRSFSIINISGLTLGFFCFIVIALYLHDELTFDMFHKDSTRIYRILQNTVNEQGEARTIAPVAARIGAESPRQLPSVQEAVRVSALGRITVGNDPASRGYERLLTTDDNFFTFFDFPLLEGDPKTVLSKPETIVISEKLAKKYFGDGSPVGKTLWSSLARSEQPVELTVSGVMKNYPKNSHLQLDIIFSEKTWPGVFPWYTKFMDSDWQSNSFLTYVKLNDQSDPKSVAEKLTTLVKENFRQEKDFKSAFVLQPLKDIHMYSENIQGIELNANGMKPFYLYMFGAVALLILLIACLNYMNLSTAAAFKRTREIGTRKTLGAYKEQLIGQFAGEAVVLCLTSFFLAVTLTQSLLPSINLFTEKQVSLSGLPLTWTFGIIATVLIAGALSALYPAYIISRVNASEALKKDIRIANRSLPVRKILVVAQFAISILMISSTVVIYKQLQFIKTNDLGFDLEDLLVIDINSSPLRRNFENVKNEFLSIPEVQSISTSTRVPGEWKSFPITTIHPDNSNVTTESIFVGIDQDFLKTYKIKLLDGRNFTTDKSDSTKVILTQLAVEQLNLKNPIGQTIEINSIRTGGSVEKMEKPFRVQVIGVIENFYFESFRQKMMPLIFGAPNTPIQRIDYYTLKVKTSDWSETLKKLQAVNLKLDADNPLEYTFLNGRFEEFYRADVKRGQIFLVFASIIVFIACLGLFALVSFAIENRTKEIGIRKVLGASVGGIVTMISKEFLTLIIIAAIISIPIAWIVMRNWLQEFAYHITLEASIFVIAGFIALTIGFITISFRTIKAAVANPVKSLKTE
jgi:putative ABC transport system permease protein